MLHSIVVSVQWCKKDIHLENAREGEKEQGANQRGRCSKKRAGALKHDAVGEAGDGRMEQKARKGSKTGSTGRLTKAQVGKRS